MLENYTKMWNEINEQIELVSSDKVKSSKDVMKIKFERNDELPLNKVMNIPVCIVVISSIFKEDGKYYPQVLLHDCFYEYEEHVNPLILE